MYVLIASKISIVFYGISLLINQHWYELFRDTKLITMNSLIHICIHLIVCEIPPWWHQQMETFYALVALSAGNSPVIGEFPSQRPLTRSFDVFFELHLNIWLSKQLRRRWFETPLPSLWRHCNVNLENISAVVDMKPTFVCLYYAFTKLENCDTRNYDCVHHMRNLCIISTISYELWLEK